MAQPVIITVAITGAVPKKADNPAVPVTPSEQIESTHEAFEAGASLVHIHVRNPDQSPGSDPELYGRIQEGGRKHCPGIPNAMPARRSIFDFLRSELKEVLPRATWVAAGIGRHQWDVNQWCRRVATPAEARHILGLRALA